MASATEKANTGKKRKHDIIPEDEDDKLEIDVSAPEPPSKKAKRKEKKESKSKSKKSKSEPAEGSDTEEGGVKIQGEEATDKKAKSAAEPAKEKRSEYGIWIGNLPFAATRESIRRFLLNEGGIDDSAVTRVHMPTAAKGQNKGFAYVDFTTQAILESALTLSERMVEGRSVLIKNAKSFEGRPQKPAGEQGGAAGKISQKPPNKRIFVGNLSFDITSDELTDHFTQAGAIENVHMATFEDSGKCKGFAWVTFADIESAKQAVQGFILKKPEDFDEDEYNEIVNGDDEELKKKYKKHKPRKWFINRYHGRELRCEFAEDAQTRYQKRHGGGANKEGRSSRPQSDAIVEADDSVEGLAKAAADARESLSKKKNSNMKHLSKDERQEMRRKRHDARLTAPGKALANTQRASAAIVEGQGSKMTFD